MLLIFDVDGTLIDGEATDWPCFTLAVREITGITIHPDSLKSGEITARSILYRTCGFSIASEHRDQVERRVLASYMEKLHAAWYTNRESFDAFPGVKKLWKHLRADDRFALAIASGDWREAVEFKLKAAGIDVSGIPIVTATDSERRTEIINIAAEKSGYLVRDVVYIGNGPWDFVAANTLGIDFIGVGKEKDHLRAAGVLHLLENMHPDAFLDRIDKLRAA